MGNESASIVQRVWNYCHVLRDDGVSYGDYVEQLTYLLFLKMADEGARLPPPLNKPSSVPAEYDWPSLRDLSGDALEVHYRHALENLGKQAGLLGVIFRKAQNKIQDPAKLRRLIDLIDTEVWAGLPIDVKGDIYEGLLQKNAEDTKSGAGQYFTPRPLISAIVEAMRPQPHQTVCDPACGTGGFLLAAHDYVSHNFALGREEKQHLREGALHGWEIVDATARLCVMNLYLHGVGGAESPVRVGDSLAAPAGQNFDVVLTNPPFGKKSSITVINEEGKADREAIAYERTDFFATTSNKQLNFLQHVYSLLTTNGKAAVVVPDNVLFEGGAGETIRRRLLKACDVHTLLRLPTGIFYAQGVKANVLFFDKRPGREEPWTERLWIYDLRTNMHFTLKTNPLGAGDLRDFVASFNPENRHDRQEVERFKSFTYDELVRRDKVSLDIFWLKDESLEDSAKLPAPELLAREISENLESALQQFNGIYEALTATPE
jgi:type I restriction enzyme M protein